MRELVFSVGITLLTGTLLFVYFRNKISNIDRKVNMVFETIQEHNNRMQDQAQEEMKRFQVFHQKQMSQQNRQNAEYNGEEENMENVKIEPTTLIDVSDQESDFSEDSESDSDSDSDNYDGVNKNETKEDNNQNDGEELKVDNNISELLNNGLEEVNVENIVNGEDERSVDERSIDDDVDSPNDGLQIIEEKLNIKNLEHLVNYNKYTKVQLRNICEEKGYTGWKSLNKGKLVTFLENQ
jgi:hypothetical protein